MNRRNTSPNTYVTLVRATLDSLDSQDSLNGTATLDEPATESLPPEVVAARQNEVMPERVGDRYRRIELLGRGGMGEVWRVWDELLNRPVACKVIRGIQSARTIERFEEEARVTAQLQHPGVLPVHDLGQLDDGRLWFTMKEVQGRTLSELIEEVHKDWRLGREGEWTFRRLIEGFRRVCEAVAYAHARGVVHRDIKPGNLMFGAYGEVSVLDWGIAKVLGEGSGTEEPVEITRDEQFTQVGVISGTPNYMAPEQAQGRSAEAGPAADVYALGATLYDLLAERPPRVVANVRKLLFQVATGEPPIKLPSSHGTGAPIDTQLEAIVMRCLEIEECDRYPSAAELAVELRLWLDGSKKRERARELVANAQQHLAQHEALLVLSAERRTQSTLALQGVAVNAPVSEKIAGWTLSDEADAAAREAMDAHNEAIHELRAALSHDPELPEAHAVLADVFAERHRQLEQAKRPDEARAAARELRVHDREDRYGAYLAGTGALTLHTDVPATVKLYRFVERHRRLEPAFERELGTTPLDAVPIEMGSYLLTLHAPGRAEVKYPVWIRRQEHWDGIAPDEEAPTVIVLPRDDELAEDDIYVPSGWFWIGDDFFEHTLALRRVWTDAFVIKKYPVTVGEYVAYLNDLLDHGREAEALEAQPTISSQDSIPFFERDREGRFVGMRPNIEGIEHWEVRPDMPVTMLTAAQCDGYASWRAAREGLAWRLPWEWERQHAVRGADQRSYPWGEHLDPTWCQMYYTEARVRVVPVHRRTQDISCFGLCGGAGNVQDFLGDTESLCAHLEGVARWGLPSAVLRGHRFCAGGASGAGPKTCMSAQRSPRELSLRFASTGMRLARFFSTR